MPFPTVLPWMRHAPVCGTMVAFSSVLSFAIHNWFRIRPGGRSDVPEFLLAPCFPFGYLSSISAGCCVVLLIYYFRILERRMGSSRFFMLCLCTTAVPTLLSAQVAWLAILATGWLSPAGNQSAAALISMRGGGTAAARALLVTCGSWGALLGALLARHRRDIPSVGATNILGSSSLKLTDKLFMYLIAGKHLIFDSFAPTAVRGTLAYQLLTFGLGYGASVLVSDRGGRFLSLLDNSRTFAWVFDNLASELLLGGNAPCVVRQSALPKEQNDGGMDADVARQLAQMGVPQQQQQGAMPPPRRMMGGAQRGALAREGRPAARGGPGMPAEPAPTAAAATGGGGDDDDEAVTLLMNIGLGCTRQEAQQALAMTGGNVDAAASLLMDRR